MNNTSLIDEKIALEFIQRQEIDLLPWSRWEKMPLPENCRQISGPIGPGVYQIKNSMTNEYIQFGIGEHCSKRMKSLYPSPYGTGTRNNKPKRDFILAYHQVLEYRTLATTTSKAAKLIENCIKKMKNHYFNT
ncbi:MAG: hypothetical protein EOO43_00420 [Flavobacterium sp.]|nr:MAG: hypothetical protein EOO43_00420 [Flavobacterium sp.]